MCRKTNDDDHDDTTTRHDDDDDDHDDHDDDEGDLFQRHLQILKSVFLKAYYIDLLVMCNYVLGLTRVISSAGGDPSRTP